MRESSRIYRARQNRRQSTRAVRFETPCGFRDFADRPSPDDVLGSSHYLLPMVESVLPRASSATLRLSIGIGVAMAGARATTPPAPTPPSRLSAPALPPVPLVDGPLAIRIVYPTAGAVIQARDSNFIFGTVGSGRASLLINGAPVPVI